MPSSLCLAFRQVSASEPIPESASQTPTQCPPPSGVPSPHGPPLSDDRRRGMASARGSEQSGLDLLCGSLILGCVFRFASLSLRFRAQPDGRIGGGGTVSVSEAGTESEKGCCTGRDVN
ncbi:hypothetical protein BD309DRAFT_950336 [Dichomitus squalens]|uniref:Uncharacterized protein n=1 Tax=Dichomitus squalens TaxID=114155 RepID=A0A4Q9QA31_9APHY|nr:hypothetical protein BD309DRAFT_950336 [Dichomitus squalens]TBU64405.1 hypothetical protein BD310DRAFT_914585 [Dichomitus squalens]